MSNYKVKKKNFWDNFRFEFVLYINEQVKREDGRNRPIICQRLFDVKGFNEDSLNSIELKELMDELTSITSPGMGVIPKFLKATSKKHCWATYKPWSVVDNNDITNIFEDEDIFTFEIKVDKRVVAKSQFSGNWFQRDVRYNVNIRDIIPAVISEIEEYLSRDEYTSTYEGYDLKNVMADHDFGRV